MKQIESNQILKSISPEVYGDLLERIFTSHGFNRSTRLRGFLAYICERAAAGHEDEINEHYIGRRVFGRNEDYDPATDNIVRVQARELRKRLAAFFAGEGSNEPIVILVPKGGYIPLFKSRTSLDSEPGDSSEGFYGAGQGSSALTYALAAVSVLLLMVAVWSYSELRKLKETANEIHEPTRTAQFWGHFFDGVRPTLFILADSNFALLQDIRREAVPFQDYASGRYFSSIASGESTNSELDRAYGMIASRHYTSLADVNTVVRLLGLNLHRSPVEIRSVRGLEIRDLKSQNSIILGSERSTPLASMFNGVRRFLLDYDPRSGRPSIRDKNPEPGKPSIYMGGEEGSAAYEAYGVVASIPNLDNDGHVLLIYGTNMQGTEAAGEFVSTAESFEHWLERIDWTTGQDLPTFEILLKLTTVGDSSYSSEIIVADYPNAPRTGA